MAQPDRVVITGVGVLCGVARLGRALAAALGGGRRGIAPAGDGGAGGPPFASLLPGAARAEAIAARAGLPEAVRRDALGIGLRAPLPVRAATAAALEAWHGARLHE